MKLASDMAPMAALIFVAIVATMEQQPAYAAESLGVSSSDVTIRILDTPFAGNGLQLKSAKPAHSSDEDLPRTVTDHVVLISKTAVVTLSATTSELDFWKRHGDNWIRRGLITLSQNASVPQFRLLTDEKYGIAVAVGSQSHKLQHVIALSDDGILEIRQPSDQTVTVRTPMRYAMVPSLIGTDLLYDPASLPSSQPCYVPSLNMVVGFLQGNDGMLVGLWPPGDQTARVNVDEKSNQPNIESLTVETDSKSFYVAFIEHPGIWHSEPLRDEYLETDTAIGWQRPFDARWIGRFFIDSDAYHFPFYFLTKRHKLWGRYIRGWFFYPVWFDGETTMVHFEKKFPPKGELLVYHLDTYDDAAELLSPVSVMQKSLGNNLAGNLLDFEGTKEQTLLKHRNAVCAMTYKIESYFAKKADAPSRVVVEQYTADIAKFIRLIRERVFEFDRFAVEMQELLDDEKKKQPTLSSDLEPIEDNLAEIRDIVEGDLPDVSLEQASAWTTRIKEQTPDDRQTSLKTVKGLTQQCRSVAGTQDDMARNLSIATFRIMEEAAQMGTASRKHVRLAENIIARCRSILRQPTWWEPCRKYLPKSNPGAP
jgi:hypothetical protein